jgi:glc operon protein GlcG
MEAIKKHLFLLFFMISLAAYSQTATQPFLSLADAERIAAAAESRARQDNWTVVIAVMDTGGHLIFLKKIDGTQTGSVEVAIAKARSAAFFKRPTKVFEDLVNQGKPSILSLPNAVAVEGGLPIYKNGVIVGAIGISGVTSEQDGIIAKAGVEAY